MLKYLEELLYYHQFQIDYECGLEALHQNLCGNNQIFLPTFSIGTSDHQGRDEIFQASTFILVHHKPFNLNN